ncbi:hypothetical protein OPT61_g496 [Boeremia exigua]|uniref:Uncharacterized protein n=1 Tax=Boeremia exigua TaxID=749465 RepID=A0ACC2ITJ4_9PLEO|nr:hypothetical protein OPT61_g496 [Boeremia exigua]
MIRLLRNTPATNIYVMDFKGISSTASEHAALPTEAAVFNIGTKRIVTEQSRLELNRMYLDGTHKQSRGFYPGYGLHMANDKIGAKWGLVTCSATTSVLPHVPELDTSIPTHKPKKAVAMRSNLRHLAKVFVAKFLVMVTNIILSPSVGTYLRLVVLSKP